MGKKSAIAILIALIFFYAGYRIYNNIQFQAAFFSDFYDAIADVPFDVTEKGASVTIPLDKYKYKTCYDVAIAIPDWYLFANMKPNEKGQVRYAFKSNGRVLKEGVSLPLSRKHTGGRKGHDLISLFVFDLPFPEAKGNLTLTMEVTTPFAFLKAYSKEIRCWISPDYSAKFNKCYNEDLHI
ncbi:hypothetical protein [Pseudodesulfovibrio sp.]|uniref:hypothetical protein n=1 Tax=unclassified Pseudodesulfovibrio TaxID=2661612 RepID=UPI003AFFC85A